MKLLLLSSIIILFVINILVAQPMRETRAVWVSTNFRLDWPPPTFDQDEQKQALLKIFDDIERKNLNTVYFQVRSNSVLLFESSIEPWSPHITGTVGERGNYDPLKFAVEEAHKRGLEIHAWINTLRCFSGTEEIIKNYLHHILNLHSNWIYKVNTDGKESFWIDPGLPEARNYLVKLINELVENYNIDGVQLDFIRYPKKDVDDEFSYSIYGNDEDIGKWRRDNITKLVGDIKNKIKSKKPFVKLGVTPIGIYKNNKEISGLEGYYDVYQDSREWLKLGIIDYAVPQIYWDIESNPKFKILAEEWSDFSYGKNLIIGIGAYKPNVKKDIEKMIEISRKVNASGIAFFRYSNIKNINIKNFTQKSLPSQMTWLSAAETLSPINLKINMIDEITNKIMLNWDSKSPTTIRDGYFTIYGLDRINNEFNRRLLKIIPNNKNSIIFSLKHPDKIDYYFTVNSVDKLWNESNESLEIVNYTIPQLDEISNNISKTFKPILIEKNEKSILIIAAEKEDDIKITPRYSKEIHDNSFAERIEKGINIINLNFNFKQYESVDIEFVNGKRVVSLKQQLLN